VEALLLIMRGHEREDEPCSSSSMKLSLESLSSFELKETLRPTTPRVLDELLLLLVLVLVLVVRSKEMLADVDGAMLLQFEFGFEFE